MNTLGYVVGAMMAALPFLASPAAAQDSVTWLSTTGNDANSCSMAAPCRMFSGAFPKTDAGGTIRCLQPGYYGGLTITKSIKITCETTESVNGFHFFLVNTPGIQVTLRDISVGAIDSFPSNYGVKISQPATVILQNVVLQGATHSTNGYGVWVDNTTGTVELSINHSTASDNRVGIRIAPTGSGSAKVAISNSHITDNGAGIQVDSSNTTGPIDVSITDTVLDGNTNSGLALSGGPGRILVNASRMTSANNGGHGVRVVNGSANVRIANSDITGNAVGVERINGGTILSSGNNHISYNALNGSVSAIIPME